MKKLFLAAGAAAMIAGLTAGAAEAQPRGNAYGYYKNGNAARKAERQADRRYEREIRRAERQWRRGEYLPREYRTDAYRVNDYSRYGLQAPPSGYGYYRQGDDVVMSALTSGLIQLVLSGALGGGSGYGYNDSGLGALGAILGGSNSGYGYGSPYGGGYGSGYDYGTPYGGGYGYGQPRGYDRYGNPVY